jgi:hypothetical protein
MEIHGLGLISKQTTGTRINDKREEKKHKKREEKNMKLLGDREAALFGGLALGSFGSSQDPGGRTQAAQVHCRWE